MTYNVFGGTLNSTHHLLAQAAEQVATALTDVLSVSNVCTLEFYISQKIALHSNDI